MDADLYLLPLYRTRHTQSTVHQGRSHAPKLPPALIVITIAPAAVAAPPVGVHRGRQAAADSVCEGHADHRAEARGGPRGVEE